MISGLDYHLLVILAALGVAAGSFVLGRSKRRYYRNRQRQLLLSQENMRAHAAALEKFLGSDGAPVTLKRVLLGFSGAMEDKDFVTDFARRLSSGPREKLTPELAEDLVAIRSRDEELNETFWQALVTGLYAALLRWPEAADLFEEAVSHTASSSRADFMARAAVGVRQADGRSGMFVPAPA